MTRFKDDKKKRTAFICISVAVVLIAAVVSVPTLLNHDKVKTELSTSATTTTKVSTTAPSASGAETTTAAEIEGSTTAAQSEVNTTKAVAENTTKKSADLSKATTTKATSSSKATTTTTTKKATTTSSSSSSSNKPTSTTKPSKPENNMGSKSEYLELLGYINQARQEAGLHKYSYKSEWQAGANQRAIDLTKSFSHTRPDGRRASTAYTDLGFDVWGFAECIAQGPKNAKDVFNGWMNSEGHRAILMSSAENSEVAIARCENYWVINIL